MHIHSGSRGPGALHGSRSVYPLHTALYVHPQTCCSNLRGTKLSKQAEKQRITIRARAQPGPDKGSVAALEAAIGAINNIIGTYNKVKGGKPASGGRQSGAANTRSSQTPAAAPAGPSKLITFSARASGNVPVKEILSATIAAQPAPDLDKQNPNISSHNHNKHSNSHHKQYRQHKHSHSSTASRSSNSWLSKLIRQSPAANVTADGSVLPEEAFARSLEAYLSLPLEQYSVLDPKLVTRFAPDTDVEAYLSELLRQQKASRGQRKAAQQQQQAPQQQQGLQQILESSSSSSSGASSEPRLRQLQKPGSSSSSSSKDSINSTNGTADVSAAAAAAVVPAANGTATAAEAHTDGAAGATAGFHAADTIAAAGPRTDGAAAEDEAAGAFLLRIPMLELLGIDLEPLLVIQVDIDEQHGQVKFRANRLVIGDDLFDQEFKVDLTATMSSKVTQQAVLTQQESADAAAGPAAAAAAAANGSRSVDSSGVAGSGREVGSLPLQQQGPVGAPIGTFSAQRQSAATAVAAATVGPETAEEPQQRVWQRGSSLGCKVRLSMTIRLPYPLSIVPGPLLSTTAGLVAKLVMQALLPSFLELLATDYGRWVSGSSTATRQAMPAGSMITAGKQHVQNLQR